MLNTPARIDIIERMGNLERADAELLRDAGTCYRAIDHGLRLHSGHAEGDLPNAEGIWPSSRTWSTAGRRIT